VHLVLDKEGAAGRKGIFMIDASKGFMKDGNKNRLRAQDIHKHRRRLHAAARAAALLAHGAAERDQRPEERLQPEPAALHRQRASPRTSRTSTATYAAASPTATSTRSSAYWKVFPGVRAALFKKADRPGYAELKVAAADIKSTIFGTPSSRPGARRPRSSSPGGEREAAPRLHAIKKGDKPKALIETLAEELLARSRRPSSSTPTTSTSTSWTTGPRPCRTTST
jgi:type I restriction enzyme M protein